MMMKISSQCRKSCVLENFLAMLEFNLHQSIIVRNSRKKVGCFDVFQLFLTMVEFKADEKLLIMQEIILFWKIPHNVDPWLFWRFSTIPHNGKFECWWKFPHNAANHAFLKTSSQCWNLTCTNPPLWGILGKKPAVLTFFNYSSQR